MILLASRRRTLTLSWDRRNIFLPITGFYSYSLVQAILTGRFSRQSQENFMHFYRLALGLLVSFFFLMTVPSF